MYIVKYMHVYSTVTWQVSACVLRILKSTVSVQSVYIYSKAYEFSRICNQSVSKSAWRIHLHIIIVLPWHYKSKCCTQSCRPWQSFRASSKIHRYSILGMTSRGHVYKFHKLWCQFTGQEYIHNMASLIWHCFWQSSSQGVMEGYLCQVEHALSICCATRFVFSVHTLRTDNTEPWWSGVHLNCKS